MSGDGARAGATGLMERLAHSLAPVEDRAFEQNDLIRFYTLRDGAPAWGPDTDEGRETIRAFLAAMDAYALYHGIEDIAAPQAAIESLLQRPESPDSAATIDFLMTDALIKLARRMRGQTVDLARLYQTWPFERREGPDVLVALAEAMRAGALNAFFNTLAPTDLEYAQLALALKDYRAIKASGGWPTVPSGPTLRAGATDERIGIVRARLEAEGYAVPPPAHNRDAHVHTPEIESAVAAYQTRNGLAPDGAVGGKTLTALNRPVAAVIDQIKANMERRRHRTAHMPVRYAIVNIAEASIRIVEDGQTVYHEPVVAGRKDRKTPMIQSAIASVIFNPSWHVPAKIAREDILPKLRKDPAYLEKMGMVISGEDDDPHGTAVDWNAVDKNAFAFRLRQAPGGHNALGRIKFDFDNAFAVYMHGTPHEELFAKAERHLSSGCVRLKDPAAFAVFVLARNEGAWDQEAVQNAVAGGRTQWLKVMAPLPLYIVYETAFFPAPDALIHFAPDVYGYDLLLTNALNRQR